MNRRQRKKWRVGEYLELGFTVRFMAPAMDDDERGDAFADAFLAELERANLAYVGSGGPMWEGHVTSAIPRQSVGAAERDALHGWLKASGDVTDLSVGELAGAWADA